MENVRAKILENMGLIKGKLSDNKCALVIYLTVVIFLDFQSTKQGLSLVDSWSRGLD